MNNMPEAPTNPPENNKVERECPVCHEVMIDPYCDNCDFDQIEEDYLAYCDYMYDMEKERRMFGV